MRALAYIQSIPWAILPSYLDLMIDVCQREGTPEQIAERIAQARAKSEERELRPAAVAARLGQPLEGASRQARVYQGVGIVPVIGPIFRYASLFDEISGVTSTEKVMRDVRVAADSSMVNSILLEIDSPGGEAFGVSELADLISEVAKKKPVVSYVSGMGASAAYWVASSADEVWVDSQAMLGSIGTVLVYDDTSKALEQRGISRYTFTSKDSPNKRPRVGSESFNNQFQQIVDDMGTIFIENVARNRGVSVKRVKSDFGAGGVIIGQAAVAAGMADKVDTFDALLSEMTAGWKRKKKMKATTAETDNPLPESGEQSGGKTTMSLKDKFLAWLDSQSPESGNEGSKAAQPAQQQLAEQLSTIPNSLALAVPTAQTGESEEVVRLRAENAKLKEERFKAAAESFANAEVLAGRAMPAEREDLIALHMQAAKDDDAQPLGEGKSRVANLQASQGKRPAHKLTSEQLRVQMPKGAVALPDSDGASEQVTGERRKELLSLTPAGQAVLAAKK